MTYRNMGRCPAALAAAACCAALLVLAVGGVELSPPPSARGAAGGWKAINLVPQTGLALKRDAVFDLSPLASCTTDDVTGATYASLAHPAQGSAWTLAVQLTSVTSQAGRGNLLSTSGWALSWDTQAGSMAIIDRRTDSGAYFTLQPSLTTMQLSLAVKATGDIQLCLGKTPLEPFQLAKTKKASAAGWISYSALSLSAGLGDISIGDAVGGLGVVARVDELWAFSDAVDCQTTSVVAQAQAAATIPNTPPAVTSIIQAPVDNVFVGDQVQITAAASGSGAPVQVRATMFGVPPASCKKRSCGDVSATTAADNQASVLVSGVYKRAGRYIVRVEASAGLGSITVQDQEIIVRKQGDTTGKARCCRYTPNLLAQQFGRPVHALNYRDASVFKYGATLGWSKDYLDNEDLESERLFDYGILAPAVSSILVATSCADTRLAGGDSPKVIGRQAQQIDTNYGHNKRILIVPQGYNWAQDRGVVQPVCADHWSGWQAKSPERVAIAYDAFGSPTKSCSYSCTPDGVTTSIAVTGFMDRLMEAIIDNSYGAVSLSWDVDVTPTVYIPYDYPADTPFAYHQNPAKDYMANNSINMATDYHSAIVLAPWAKHKNQGYLAWSGGGQDPYIFVLKCNPQHYYITHEMGHRFGLFHSSVYRLDAATTTPSNPAAGGIIEDSYSDKLDIMACCRSDYNLHGRIMAGWVSGSEREHISMQAVTTGQNSYSFELWPFDRAESRGKLKGLTLRLAADKLLVIGFRSLAGWEDVSVSRPPNDAADGALAYDEMRTHVRGLSVEYVKKYLSNGSPTWTTRGLLDFNVMFGLYKGALPQSAGAYSPEPAKSAFALLKEGFAWVNLENRLMVLVQSIGPCSSAAEVPVYNYSAKAFFGARGELPGQEFNEQSDFTGYNQLECMKVSVQTGFNSNPGMLDVRVVYDGLDANNRVNLASSCGFKQQPRLRLVLPDGVRPLSVVWSDPLKRTFATGDLAVDLPPFDTIREHSGASASKCTVDCPKAYTVKVVGPGGEQTQVEITIQEVSIDRYAIRSKYTYFMLEAITNRYETLYTGVARTAPVVATSPQGMTALAKSTRLSASAIIMKAASLPVTSCSSQWTISATLKVVTMPAGAEVLILSASPDATTMAAQPALYLKRSADGTLTYLAVSFAGQAQQTVNATAWLPNSLGTLSVTLVRDASRLGLWIAGGQAGSWVLQDVWCAPSRPTINYCDHAAVGSGFALPGLRFGGVDTTANVEVGPVKVYNYAIPVTSLAAEATCIKDNTCGAFLLKNYQIIDSSTVPASSTLDADQTTIIPTTKVSTATSTSTPFVQVGSWGACSLPCGGGIASRSVRCLKPDGTEVPITQCPKDQIAATTKPCNTVACPATSLIATDLPVSSCATTCGEGVTGLAAMCRSSLGVNVRLQDCSAATSYPSNSLPAAVVTFPSLNDMALAMALGNFNKTCSSPTCSRYKAMLGSWGSCSKPCGGGTRNRTITCIDTTTGSMVAATQCSTEGTGIMLQTPCNTQPCQLYAWMVGPWGLCSGELGIGSQLRTVSCVNASAGSQVDESNCAGRKPAHEAYCVKTAHKSGLCIPVNFPTTTKDCFGNGTCTQTGCVCKTGYSGTYCEVPPSCAGAMTADRQCCATGVLAVDGTCCPDASILDRDGHCCTGKKLDGCGVCGGAGTTVDLQGQCCSGPLDQGGACCASGKVDECGVCDGDGASCGAIITLQALVDNSSTTYTDTLKQRLAASLGLEAKNVIFLTQVLVPTGSTTPVATGFAGLEVSVQPTSLAAQSESIGNRSVAQSTEPTHAGRPTACALDEQSSIVLVPATAWQSAAPSAGRQLQQASSTQKTVAVTYRVRFASATIETSRQAVTAANIFATASGLASAAAASAVSVKAVSQVDRVGVCGNGICETGEQSIFLPADSVTGATGQALYSSTIVCSEDCPISIMMCGAPTALGDSKMECGGNGRCLHSTGHCDCYEGYVGSTCGECQAGWYNRGGRCIPQFFDGKTVFDNIPATIEGVTAPKRKFKLGLKAKVLGLSMVGWVGLAGGVIGLLALGACLGIWCWRRREPQAAAPEKTFHPIAPEKGLHPPFYGTYYQEPKEKVGPIAAASRFMQTSWGFAPRLYGVPGGDMEKSSDPRKTRLLMEEMPGPVSQTPKLRAVPQQASAGSPRPASDAEVPHLQALRKLRTGGTPDTPGSAAARGPTKNVAWGTPKAAPKPKGDDSFL